MMGDGDDDRQVLPLRARHPCSRPRVCVKNDWAAARRFSWRRVDDDDDETHRDRWIIHDTRGGVSNDR